MIPLRDDTERVRAPLLAALAALTCAVAALAALVTGASAWTALLLALDAGVIWVFGAGVEGAVSRFWLLVGLVFGGVGGAAIALTAGSEGLLPVAAAGATGAALETIATHLLRLRGARVMSIVLVPWFGGFAEVPALAWGAIWAVSATVLLLLGAAGG